MLQKPITSDDAEYLLQVAGPDGWLADEVDRSRIRPYMGSYLAIGFVAQYYLTGSQKYLQAAWAWLEWYAAKNDVNGVTHDYQLAQDGSSQWVLTDLGANSVDSTDGYAGMFMNAAYHVWKASQDLSRMNNLLPALMAAVGSISSTQQLDGLTWAKPAYPVKYLEDNIEGLAGLRSAELLGTAIGSSSLHSVAQVVADKMAQGIAFMWNQSTGTFDWAIDQFNVRTTQDWSDESAQRQHIWAVAYAAVPDMAGYAAGLMATYETNFPDWRTNITNGYEVMGIMAYLRIGATSTAQAALTAMKANRDTNANAYPYNTLSGGELLYAERMINDMPALNIPILGGTNLILGSSLQDANSDGAADVLLFYSNPANGVSASSIAGANQQRLTVAVSPAVGAIDFANIAVTPGLWYCFSAYLTVTSLGSGAQIAVVIEWLDSGGSSITYGYEPLNATGTGRYYWTRPAPANAAFAKCGIHPDSNTDCSFWGPQFELGGSPTTYILT